MRLLRRLHDPDFRICVGEWELAETTLRVFIENARLDPGMGQPMQQEMGLRQVRRGTQTPHAGSLAAAQ